MYEIVKIVELDPIKTLDPVCASFHFRIEILKKCKTRNIFKFYIYRKECFRVQPTFPQENGIPQILKADHEFFIKDELFANEDNMGRSVDEAFSKAHKQIQTIFAGKNKK